MHEHDSEEVKDAIYYAKASKAAKGCSLEENVVHNTTVLMGLPMDFRPYALLIVCLGIKIIDNIVVYAHEKDVGMDNLIP